MDCHCIPEYNVAIDTPYPSVVHSYYSTSLTKENIITTLAPGTVDSTIPEKAVLSLKFLLKLLLPYKPAPLLLGKLPVLIVVKLFQNLALIPRSVVVGVLRKPPSVMQLQLQEGSQLIKPVLPSRLANVISRQAPVGPLQLWS